MSIPKERMGNPNVGVAQGGCWQPEEGEHVTLHRIAEDMVSPGKLSFSCIREHRESLKHSGACG